MSAAAVVIIINRPPNTHSIVAESQPTVDHSVIGDVTGLDLSDLVRQVADALE